MAHRLTVSILSGIEPYNSPGRKGDSRGLRRHVFVDLSEAMPSKLENG